MASIVPQPEENPNISKSNNHSVSLQRQEGWTEALLLHENFWFPEFVIPRIPDIRRHFVACPTDIIISTFPRSGTIWLKSLLYAIIHRSRHALGDPNHPILTRSSHDLVPFLESPSNHSPTTTIIDILRNLDALPSPRLISTHLSYSLLPPSVADSGCRLVYLCCDPKDNFVSIWHFIKKVIVPKEVELDKAFQMYCEGSSPFGPVWEHNIQYWRASKELADKILFLTYEEVTAAPAATSRRLAEFVGHPFTADEEKQNLVEEIVGLCSIERMKSSAGNGTGAAKVSEQITVPNAAFLRKGTVGDWSNYLSPEMGEKLDSIVEEKLRGTGLTFQRS
uniref:Sulfotransferase n=1 Tax=Ananas comosus var. bracteatus TaxID=296719 RepID=A0A6V7Q343_ANACO|nr:unnamed protein product [Ananas comosus var. bracteatus]